MPVQYLLLSKAAAVPGILQMHPGKMAVQDWTPPAWIWHTQEQGTPGVPPEAADPEEADMAVMAEPIKAVSSQAEEEAADMAQKAGLPPQAEEAAAVGDLPEKMLMVSTAAAVVATVPVTTAAEAPERLPGNQASL